MPVDARRARGARARGGRGGRAASRPTPASTSSTTARCRKPSYATYVKDRLAGFGGTGNTFVYQDLVDFPKLAKRVFGDPGRSRRKTPACNAPIGCATRRRAQADIDHLKAALAAARPRRRVHDRGVAGRGLAVLPQRALPDRGGLSVRDRRRDAARIRGGRQGRHRAADRLSRSRAWAATSSTPISSLAGIPQAARSCTSRRSTTRSPTSRPSSCACICAGATTKARTTATCRSPTSSTSCSRRGRSAISFEAANPRHAHEWAVFETVKLPDGKVLIPGVIESKSNFIEHPGADRAAHRPLREARGPRERHRRQRLRLRHLGRPGRGRSRRRVGEIFGHGRGRADRIAPILDVAITCETGMLWPRCSSATRSRIKASHSRSWPPSSGPALRFSVSTPAHSSDPEQVREQFQSAPCVVWLWSRSAARSASTKEEIHDAIHAWSEGRLVLATIDNTALPVGLRDLQGIPVRKDLDGLDLAELLAEVRALVDQSRTRPPAPVSAQPTAAARSPVSRPAQQRYSSADRGGIAAGRWWVGLDDDELGSGSPRSTQG